MNPKELFTAFYTIVRKDVVRVFRIWPQTFLPSVVTSVLYFLVFGTVIGSRIGGFDGFKYIQFIKEQRRHGVGLTEATLGAVRIRFRPVIMTSLAFFFGTLPLAIASGAVAGAMNAIGTAVTGGMLSATFIDLIFIPLFFVLISQLFMRKQPQPSPEQSPASTKTTEVS